MAFGSARIVSTAPLITISRSQPIAPLGLASVAGSELAGAGGLHLVMQMWHGTTRKDLARLDATLAGVRQRVPGEHFIVLANTEYAAFRLAERGVPCVLANESIFTDETLYRPDLAAVREFDAVYNARFAAFKRHELAVRLDRLLLVYDHRSKYDERLFRRFRRRHRRWCFLNHEHGGGDYARLSPGETAAALSRARVGLALSETEGGMRASIEYLLCGLPVVSTPCYGGRERYYLPGHTRWAEPDPDAVAAAVRDLVRLNIDPGHVRRETLRLVNADRASFLRVINHLVRDFYGVNNRFSDFEPFRGDPPWLEEPALRRMAAEAAAAARDWAAAGKSS